MHKIKIMTNKFPPNTDPNIFAFTAAIIGAIVSDEFNAQELNSIGNWFELLGQYFLTYAAQKQLITSRQSNNNNNQSHDLDYILKAIKKIEAELDEINRK